MNSNMPTLPPAAQAIRECVTMMLDGYTSGRLTHSEVEAALLELAASIDEADPELRRHLLPQLTERLAQRRRENFK